MAGKATPPHSPGLAEAALAVASGASSPQALHEAFLRSTVFCEAGESPGFIAVGAPPDGLIPILSSERELFRARGAVAWFATTGADLLSLVPAGYDLVLDAAGDAPLRLNLDAV